VREYVQGLERELEGAYADLDMALAELDGTKGELDEVLAELEACRADLEGLDMTRHKVKTLRVCLDIAKQSQRKAVGQAEGMKRELRKAESLLGNSSREMRKLKQENESMRTALGALFLNLTMAVRSTPPHTSNPTPPPPRLRCLPLPPPEQHHWCGRRPPATAQEGHAFSGHISVTKQSRATCSTCCCAILT